LGEVVPGGHGFAPVPVVIVPEPLALVVLAPPAVVVVPVAGVPAELGMHGLVVLAVPVVPVAPVGLEVVDVPDVVPGF